MKKMLVFIILAIALIRVSNAADRNFFVTNDTDQDVTGLWMSHESVTKWFWVSGFQPIAPGERLEVAMAPLSRTPENCNIKIQFRVDDTIWYYSKVFDVCTISDFQVYYNPFTKKYGMKPH